MSRARRSSLLFVVLLCGLTVGVVPSVAVPRPATAATALECRADRPVVVGGALTFRVRDPQAGSTYQWSGSDGLSATGAVVTWTYGAPGWKLATVSQLDGSGGVLATATCGMHVLPPPGGAASVAPVLWVPANVDPAPLVPQLDRVWRSIRAAYYHHYGHTFVLEPVRAVRSTRTEADICGGDCADLGLADTLMHAAFDDANAVAPVVPYRRYSIVMAWGTGGWAGSWGWDIALGGVGDWATATAAGVLVPKAEPNLPDWAAAMFGSYSTGVDTMWHESNHGIGWDENNGQFIDLPPTQWELDVVALSPWLTEIPADSTPPSVSITAPAGGSTVSGTATVRVDAGDGAGMDAVGLVVDGQLRGIDTSSPYTFNLDTLGLSSDRHQLTAIAYDAAGNTAQQTISVDVLNQVGGACNTNPPVGRFYACLYSGTNFNTYLRTMVDGVDRLDTGAVAWGPRHSWPTGAAFNGLGSQISGRWKGVVDLPAGNYLFHVLADDGVRLRVNGQLVLDQWQVQVQRFTAAASGLGGATTIEVDWYQNEGGKALELWWQPTTVAPAVTVQPADQSVVDGAAVTFTAAASGSPTPTVQWQSSIGGGPFTDVPGATSPALGFVARVSGTGTRYRAVFTNTPAGQPPTTTLTRPATLTVNAGGPTIVPGQASIVEGNSGAKVLQVPVSLSAPSGQTVTASWTTLNYEAVAPGDFTAASGTVTFAPGQTTQTVSVTIKGDTLDEPDERFLVSFTNPTNAIMGGFYGLGFGTITDDDPAPTIVPGQASIVEGNSGVKVLQVPVSLSAPSGQTVTASWTTLNYEAVAPGDFTAASGTVTFAPGQTTQTVSVTIKGDTLDEPDERFLVSFTNPTNAIMGGFYGLGFGTITDDDPAPTIVPGQASIVEGNSGVKVLQVPVSLSAPSGQTVTASWTTLNYEAVAPGDFTAASGTVTFAPGQTTQTVSVTVKGDTLDEPDERFLVSFTNPTNAIMGGFYGLGFGTITDDD